tara:strand:- start:1864 stop:2403 length:540 start_codon:yes stop_codon:yes gene_type:complete
MTEETREAKVPSGMTIKKPDQEQNKQPKGLPVKQFDVDPGLPIIQYPHYTNNAKTELACLLVRPDGQASMEGKIPKDDNHPLYRDIFAQFTEEEILTNTNREVQLQTARNKAAEEATTAREREEKRAKLWEVKSEFMEMDVVKNSSEKSLKRNLRKAATWFEALAYGCAILIKEDSKSE